MKYLQKLFSKFEVFDEIQRFLTPDLLLKLYKRLEFIETPKDKIVFS